MNALMPQPRRVVAGSGRLALHGWRVRTTAEPDAGVRAAIAALETRLRARTGLPDREGLTLDVTAASMPDRPRLHDDESYRLVIDDSGAVVEGHAGWALATLIQLVDADGAGAFLPHAQVEDAPRFAWRGLMVDVARHYIEPATLHRTLDVMAFYRLNVLHLHLSDDQAFRFRGAAHPELASADHYSPETLRGIVAAASARGIRVVPELDMPGHVTSWLAARPEWGAGPAVEPSTRFGVHAACLNPRDPAVLAAVAALLGELADVFPDEYVHFGGDEVDPTWWRAAGIADPKAAQAEFNRAVIGMLEGVGRKAVAWDEVLHPELPRETLIQAWRGSAALAAAVGGGFDCLFSSPYYLDLFYPADYYYGYDPGASGAALEARDAALRDEPRFAHVRSGMVWGTGPEAPERTTGQRPGRVLGGEACMWAELVTDELFDVRVWSRMPAIAERFWSEARFVDADDMHRRLERSHAVLATAGVVDLQATTDRQLLRLGLTRSELDALRPLIEMLEPVKWYARLLGAETLAARVAGAAERSEARPYATDTPLNRVVDVIPPESIAARKAAVLIAGDDELALRELTYGWRRQRDAFVALADPHPAIAELDAVSARLYDLAEALDAKLDGEPPGLDESVCDPLGEYLLPVARDVLRRIA